MIQTNKLFLLEKLWNKLWFYFIVLQSVRRPSGHFGGLVFLEVFAWLLFSNRLGALLCLTCVVNPWGGCTACLQRRCMMSTTSRTDGPTYRSSKAGEVHGQEATPVAVSRTARSESEFGVAGWSVLRIPWYFLACLGWLVYNQSFSIHILIDEKIMNNAWSINY